MVAYLVFVFFLFLVCVEILKTRNYQWEVRGDVGWDGDAPSAV